MILCAKDPESKDNVENLPPIPTELNRALGGLRLLMAGEPYETEKLEGDVDFEWTGDWYDAEAVVEYRPEGVEGGRLKMIYRF